MTSWLPTAQMAMMGVITMAMVTVERRTISKMPRRLSSATMRLMRENMIVVRGTMTTPVSSVMTL